MSDRARKTTIRFLKTIGFTRGTRIWLRASWDHKTEPAPSRWRKYRINDKTIYCQYIFCGRITRKGFSLTKCTYGGRDKYGSTIWKPSTKKHTDGFAHVFKLSRIGATISFYPNQPTCGISNNHVKSCQTIFYEIDNLPLENQWDALQQLKQKTKLEPAAVVFTGGKSLHCYFRAKTALTPEQWLILNRKLTITQTSDPAICNLARAMRLPGLFRRRVVDGVLSQPIPITVEQWSNCQYSPEQLESALFSTGLFPCGLLDEQWRKWVHLLRKKHNGEDVNPNSVLLLKELQQDISKERLLSHSKRRTMLPLYRQNSTSLLLKQQRGSAELIPLSVCLTQNDQTLIKQGDSQGNRNNSGYKLARNLLGTSAVLSEQGIGYYQTPQSLFRQYCKRCNPPLDTEEALSIWQSANSKPAYPTRDAASIARSIKWWRSRNGSEQALQHHST